MATLMDGLQLPLPAGWAREFPQPRDPVEELDKLARDKLAARAEIREALDRLAAKYALSTREVGKAVQGYADDMLNDASYELERELNRQIEEQDIP